MLDNSMDSSNDPYNILSVQSGIEPNMNRNSSRVSIDTLIERKDPLNFRIK